MRAVTVVGVLFLAVCTSSGTDRQSEARALQANDVPVISVVLDELSKSPRTEAVFVVSETAAFLPASWKTDSDVRQPVSPTQMVTISRELIDEYSERNSGSYPIPRAAIPRGVRLIDRVGIDRQPTGTRIIHVSAPGYGAAGTRALISFSVTEGPLTGGVGFILLRKNRDGWDIETVVPFAAA